MTSNVIYGRAWPRCDSPLTVGPHTYMPTCPGVIDLKTSFCLEYELYIFSSLMFTCEAKPKQSPLFFCYQLLYYYHRLLLPICCFATQIAHLCCIKSIQLFQHTDDTDITDQNGFYSVSQNIDYKTSVFICSIRVIRVLFAQQRTERLKVPFASLWVNCATKV